MKYFTINPKRELLPDLLKGIAVVFMIQVHITENFSSSDFYNSLAGKISLFLGGVPAAPLFMIVMGYFFAASTKSSGQNFKRGAALFLGGIFLNIFRSVFYLINTAAENYSSIVLSRIFAVDIFPLAGLSLMFLSQVKKYFQNDWYLYFLTALFAAFLGEVLVTPALQPGIEQNLLGFIFGNYPSSFFPLIPWLAYPLLGAAIYFGKEKLQKKFEFTRNHIIIFSAAWILVMAFTYNYGFEISSTLGLYYHHGIIFAAWACCFLAGFILAVKFLFRKENYATTYLRWLGENVTAIYVAQWLIIGNMEYFKINSGDLWELALWFLIVLFSSTLVVAAWRKGKGRVNLI